MSSAQGPGNIGPIVRPDIRSLFDTERTSAAVAINKIQIGQIVSWIPGSQSATVQLVNQRVVFNAEMTTSTIPPSPNIIPYPLLVNVPVFVLSGGTAFLGMPITQGDPCIVLFNDRDLDPWWSNGTTGSPPHSPRVHDLNDGMALVGVRPATSPIASLPSDGQHMTMGNASGTLREAMDALFAALIAAVISGTSFNPATITAITAAQTKFDALFQ